MYHDSRTESEKSFNFSLQSKAFFGRVPVVLMKITLLDFYRGYQVELTTWRPFNFFKVFDLYQNVRPRGVRVKDVGGGSWLNSRKILS